MYVACLGLWIDIDYCTQLAGPLAHGDLVRPVHAHRTVNINILNVYTVSDIFAHPIHCD